MRTYMLKGDIIHAPVFGALVCIKNAYLVCENEHIVGIYENLPTQYRQAALHDFSGKLIIPSFSDMHLHAPQFAMLGTGMDLQLLEWLKTYTFPTETRFKDIGYARELYAALAASLIRVGTTRVCMFSSIHRESTHILIEELEKHGITGLVGKVNMDRNSPEDYCETTVGSLAETKQFLEECAERYTQIRPIITPRFTPSGSDELMRGLGELALGRGLPVQSHLNENLAEIDWVSSLCPSAKYYYESYACMGLFKKDTLMAHCVHMTDQELAAMQAHGVWAVHCPDSNLNVASGLAPVRRMLQSGVSVALGSDIAGGALLSMMDVATAAIRVSKLRWLHSDKREAFLTFAEAFYLATSSGSLYFGEGAGFQKGAPLHALVLDDSALPPQRDMPPAQRLERVFYLAPHQSIIARFSAGKQVFA